MSFSSSTDSYRFVYDMELTAEALRVDEEIAKQIRLLCDLQTQKNSFLPISRLPTETLTAIFICSARDYHSTHDGCPTETAPSWVNVSYVCRRWRNVALNCATLWSYLFITSPRWTEELLARSKQVSLKLHAEVYQGYSSANGRAMSFVRQIMNSTERIQELHLNLPTMCFTNHFRSSPAPCLQNLKISGGYQNGPSQGFSVFFDGDTPALRTLELSSCPMPWHSFTLNRLTTLDLRSVPSQCRQNMVEFLATLSCAQDLRHLYLQDALASAAGFLSSTEFRSFQKINLPRLSRLLIAAPFSAVIAFLACVNIPMKTEVRLDCSFEVGSSLHDCAPLFSVVAQRSSTSTSQALSSPTFRSLVIDLTGFREALTFSSLERDPFDLALQQDWGCDTSLKIRVRWFVLNTGRDLECIMDDISSFVPLMDIQSVHVLRPPVSPAVWRSVLGHLQDLRFLRLSSGDLPDLVPLLFLTNPTTSEGAEGQGGHTNRSRNWMLAPALEGLELHEISFWKRKKKEKCPIDVQALCDALAVRKGSSGQVTVTRGIERIRRGRAVQEKRFDMVGCWKNGRFHVEKHVVE